jgi:hypothetical protein
VESKGFFLNIGFSSCLQESDPEKADLQRVILELVALLAKYSISPAELSLYLSFFKAKVSTDQVCWRMN